MNLLGKREFADFAKVTPGAISGALKTHLKPALNGKLIDAEHPAAIEYLERSLKRQLEYNAGRLKSGRGSPRYTARIDENLNSANEIPGQMADGAAHKLLMELPKDIRDLADLSLRELIARWGTAQHFSEWLKALRTMEKIQKDKLANAVTEGVLVSRQLVSEGVLEPLNTAHMKLLTDGVRKIVARLDAMQSAGRDRIERENWTRKTIGQFIAGAKLKAKRRLGEV